jgi:hypothetical protein
MNARAEAHLDQLLVADAPSILLLLAQIGALGVGGFQIDVSTCDSVYTSEDPGKNLSSHSPQTSHFHSKCSPSFELSRASPHGTV